MICELKDVSKAEWLFSGIEDSIVRSCLAGMMGGKIYVTDAEKPKSAAAFLACFVFYVGEPSRELVMAKPRGLVCMVPQNAEWEKLITECHPCAGRDTRYAIRKDTRFQRDRLRAIAASLPEGYEFRRIDAELYDACLGAELFTDCVCHFSSVEEYLSLGRGYAVIKEGRIVSAASSYTVFPGGIEVEIDTVPEERRKGLASAVGAKLILSCLDDGLYPSWDAANMDSVRLAQRLGYELDREYTCWWLDGSSDQPIKDPDRPILP
ncbi:MAG: GNAT family N-acetyltransferase [Clostridia bacterium]|nr:GNAT family N-acetyltransferase [Clostridia bacterium]